MKGNGVLEASRSFSERGSETGHIRRCIIMVDQKLYHIENVVKESFMKIFAQKSFFSPAHQKMYCFVLNSTKRSNTSGTCNRLLGYWEKVHEMWKFLKMRNAPPLYGIMVPYRGDGNTHGAVYFG